MENMIRHAQGGLVQLAQYFGKSITPMANSTLNEKFNVATHNDVSLPGGAVHRAQYWGIGNGGMHVSALPGSTGVMSMGTWPHITKHTGLYNQVPFRVAPVSADLSALEREKYRLRVRTMIGVDAYWFYYLRKIDLNAVNINMEKRTEVNGVITPSALAHDLSDLSPTVPSVGVTIAANGDYSVAVARLPFTLTEEDTTHFVDAINLLYGGDTAVANITELALCTGVDISYTYDGVTYTEAAHVRVANSCATAFTMHSLPTGLETFVNVEAVDAMLGFVA